MREHHHLQILIERMQREGYPEPAIREAVRRAKRDTHDQPRRRQPRFGLFRRGRGQ
jgi:hypothetical protein